MFAFVGLNDDMGIDFSERPMETEVVSPNISNKIYKHTDLLCLILRRIT